MNAVVLTAALSSCNSGLYSTGRVLRALADKGEAPALTGRMNSRHVPYGGILLTSVIYVLGVVLNYIVPQEAFDIAIVIASLGVVATCATLIAFFSLPAIVAVLAVGWRFVVARRKPALVSR
jgi:L-asparagine permease